MITYMHIAQELPKYGLKRYNIVLQFTCNCTGINVSVCIIFCVYSRMEEWPLPNYTKIVIYSNIYIYFLVLAKCKCFNNEIINSVLKQMH